MRRTNPPASPSGAREPADAAARRRGDPGAGAAFLIVGIGASAGGLEAFTQLLKDLPLDTGMAFVLVQHLDPRHESALTQILSRATSMDELARFNRAAVGRELRMIELKKEVNELCRQSSGAARYALEFEQAGKDAE